MERKTRVLIVEDDEYSREAYSHLLTAEGYEAAVAADGDEGLEKARALQPDVLLLDLGLPGLQGRDMIRTLKSDAATRSVAILVVTGQDTHAAEAAVESGAAAYLIKPVDFQDLKRAISDLKSAPDAI